jgi:hypothetical protein
MARRTAWLAGVLLLPGLAGCSPPVYPYAVTVTEWRGAIVCWEVGFRDRNLLAKRYEDLGDPARLGADRVRVG